MKDVWKELQQRAGEELPLTGLGGSSSRFPTYEKAKPASPAAQEESDLFDTGFTLRDLGPQVVRLWLSLQVLGLVFQFMVWREASSHLAEYEGIIASVCAPERLTHGICTGLLWNVSSYQDFVLADSNSWSKGHSFEFSTRSTPPTFILVVDPVSRTQGRNAAEPAAAPGSVAEAPELDSARWSLEVERVSPPQLGSPMRRFYSGQEALAFEDLSDEARHALTSTGRVEWRATLSARLNRHTKTRYLVYVEDSTGRGPAPSAMAGQCSLARSWKAFNEQHQGHSHSALSKCRFWLGFLLLLGAAAVAAVRKELEEQRLGGSSRRFHIVVAAKFLVQDVPMQVCLVLYLLGWYEASGLRCQLCLLHPGCETCRCPGEAGAEQAFHLANAAAVLFTLLSSMSNQLLIRPVVKRTYTEDDICLQYCIRIGGLCVSTLPFSTGICLASRSVLPLPTLWHLLAALPCAMGWLGLACLLCIPVILCCEEDWDV